MRPKTYSSEAIILANRPFSEADRLVVVYCRDYGKQTLIAKGVRKPKSKKGRNIEVFNQVKLSAARGKNLDILTEVEIINPFTNLRKDLKKTSVAYFYIEAIGRITREDEKNKELYNLLLEYLTELKGNKMLKRERERYIKNILILSGYWPKEKSLKNPDDFLEEILEREMSTRRVAKKVLA